MRRKARALIRLKEAIGKRVARRHFEVWRDFVMRDVAVCSHRGRRAYLAQTTARPHVVKAVELAVRALGHERAVLVADVVRSGQRSGSQHDRLALGVLAATHGVGTAQPVEQVVNRAIFLKDHDDVLDLRRRTNRHSKRKRRNEGLRGYAAVLRTGRKHQRHQRRAMPGPHRSGAEIRKTLPWLLAPPATVVPKNAPPLDTRPDHGFAPSGAPLKR